MKNEINNFGMCVKAHKLIKWIQHSHEAWEMQLDSEDVEDEVARHPEFHELSQELRQLVITELRTWAERFQNAEMVRLHGERGSSFVIECSWSIGKEVSRWDREPDIPA